MPRPCSVCAHHNRNAIDKAIAGRTASMESMARENALSADAIGRHREHVRERIVKATAIAEVADADDLLAKVRGYIRDAERIMKEATTEADKRLALQAMDRALAAVTLVAKLSGEIREGTDIKVLIQSPHWAEVQSRILSALQPYPDAKEAVLQALRPMATSIPATISA